MLSTPFYLDPTKVGLPFVPVGIGDFMVLMLADTGATDNHIFEYVYKDMGDVFSDTGESAVTHGISGNIIQKIVSGKLYINETEYPTKFIIGDSNAGLVLSKDIDCPIAGIIGSKFMLQHKWVIDYEKQRVFIAEP